MMSLETIKRIRAVESMLLSQLNVKRDDSFNYSKLNNRARCRALLSECAAPRGVNHIYTNYIIPIYIYLDFINNYLTMEKFSNDYESLKYTKSELSYLYNTGRDLINELVLEETKEKQRNNEHVKTSMFYDELAQVAHFYNFEVIDSYENGFKYAAQFKRGSVYVWVVRNGYMTAILSEGHFHDHKHFDTDKFHNAETLTKVLKTL